THLHKRPIQQPPPKRHSESNHQRRRPQLRPQGRRPGCLDQQEGLVRVVRLPAVGWSRAAPDRGRGVHPLLRHAQWSSEQALHLSFGTLFLISSTFLKRNEKHISRSLL
ncbi:hypothetical protein CSIM01_03183, partial [Colletotrichum simmondsii]